MSEELKRIFNLPPPTDEEIDSWLKIEPENVYESDLQNAVRALRARLVALEAAAREVCDYFDFATTGSRQPSTLTNRVKRLRELCPPVKRVEATE